MGMQASLEISPDQDVDSFDNRSIKAYPAEQHPSHPVHLCGYYQSIYSPLALRPLCREIFPASTTC